MKTVFITIIALIIYENGFCQNEKYFQKMGESLSGFATVERAEDYLEVASAFERIANVETQQWLPLYYHAQCYILISFVDKEADGDKKDSYLDIAEGSINKMIELAPEESEIFALQSFMYTGRIVVNPMERGMTFGQKSGAAIKASLALNPENPRAKYLKLSNDIGMASFFGADTKQFCEQASQLLADWDSYTLSSDIHPSWGKDLVLEIINDCNGTEENADAGSSTTETSEGSADSEMSISSRDGMVLTINIAKLPSDDGLILLEVLNEKEESVASIQLEVADGQSQGTIEGLPAGKYGIQYFHDENGNGKMDANKWGMPTEAYGFSNNARGSFGPPDFEKTLFDLNSDLSLSLKAK